MEGYVKQFFLFFQTLFLAVCFAGAPVNAATVPLTFVSPAPSSIVTASQVDVSLSVRPDVEVSSIKLSLNGRELSEPLHERHSKGRCLQTTSLIALDGLMPGKNVLSATGQTKAGVAFRSKVRFLWQTGLTTSETSGVVPVMLPPSLNLYMEQPAAGTQTWLSISGGQTSMSFPHYGTDSTTQPSNCTGANVLQLLVLDRSQLTQVSYTCFYSSSTLKTALTNVTSSQLAIVATTWPYVAPPGLDTSDIGGTNYSQVSNSAYPRGYMAIGVGKATNGASEYYWVDQSSVNPNPWAAQFLGLLVETSNVYTFHPSEMSTFDFNPNAGGKGPALTIGGKTYTPPSSKYTDGLWVLVMDRDFLRPIDGEDGNTFLCGQIFGTGMTDGSGGEEQQRLATYLSTLTDRNLVFITSVGHPFAGPVGTGSAPYSSLTKAISALGGSEYDVTDIFYNTPDAVYSLISVPTNPNFKSSLAGHAVVSTTLNSAAKQTGHVAGMLSRDVDSLFVPSIWSNIASGATAPDLSYAPLILQQGTAWPYSQNNSQLAAYHYISQQLYDLVIDPLQETPRTTPSRFDWRSYYYGGQTPTVLGNTHDPTTFTPPGQYDDPVLGITVSVDPTDFMNVAKQLNLEKAVLQVVYSQMEGSGLYTSYASLFAANNTVGNALSQAATDILSDSLNVSGDTNVGVNIGNMLNTAAALTALFSEAPGVSFLSSTLWLASSVANSATPGVIPNGDQAFLTALKNLTDAAQPFAGVLSDGFAVSLDTLYSDWGKLSAAQAKIAGDGPWAITSQTDLTPLQTALHNAAHQSFYMQLLPSVTELDTYTSVPVNDTKDLGNWGTFCELGSCQSSCSYFYQIKLPPAANTAVFQMGGSTNGGTSGDTYDAFVAGGNIVPAKTKGEEITEFPDESFPGAGVLQTVFDTFHVPARELFANSGPLTRRDGPWVGVINPCYPNGLGASNSPAHTNCNLWGPHFVPFFSPFTLKAQVTSASGKISGGSIILRDEKNRQFEVPLGSNGVATWTLKGLKPGQHTFQATYQGADGFAPSMSKPFNVTIGSKRGGWPVRH